MSVRFRLCAPLRVRYLFQMGDYKGDNTTGFQSPAQDYVEDVVDLAAMLDLRRPGRYPVRVKGRALASRGIRDGDILVADAAAEPKPRQSLRRNGWRRRHPRDPDQAGRCLRVGPSSGPIITIADDVEVWAIVQALVRTQALTLFGARRWQQLLLFVRARLRSNTARQTHCRAVEQ
ncbi:MAG: hypothetical protein IPO30_20775 [Hyphomonadaceae bacterium]|nr:hypothetical protein [Hyphomonadaceae bacterium]